MARGCDEEKETIEHGTFTHTEMVTGSLKALQSQGHHKMPPWEYLVQTMLVGTQVCYALDRNVVQGVK